MKNGKSLISKLRSSYIILIFVLITLISFGVLFYHYYWSSDYHLEEDFHTEYRVESGDSSSPHGIDIGLTTSNELTFYINRTSLEVEFTSLDIKLANDFKQDERLTQLCIDDFTVAYQSFGKLQSKVIIESPICPSFRYDANNNYYFTDPIDIYNVTGNVQAIYFWPRNRNILYPLDSQVFRFNCLLKYTAITDKGNKITGVLTPYLAQNNLKGEGKNGYEIAGSEVFRELRLAGYESLPSYFVDSPLFGYESSITIGRTILIRILFVSVMLCVTGFLIVTYFIEKLEVYLASVLVFLFSLISIKQMFPLPLSINYGLLDFLIPFYYVLIGISGVQFLIRNYVLNKSKRILQIKVFHHSVHTSKGFSYQKKTITRNKFFRRKHP